MKDKLSRKALLTIFKLGNSGFTFFHTFYHCPFLINLHNLERITRRKRNEVAYYAVRDYSRMGKGFTQWPEEIWRAKPSIYNNGAALVK